MCSIQILLCPSPCSATCLPTTLCGGTVSPSWHLHSSACPTCICMNWETCGRSSSMWQSEPSWPCRSDWGNRWEKRQTTTSDKNLKHKGQLDLRSDVLHVPWKCSRDGSDQPEEKVETKEIQSSVIRQRNQKSSSTTSVLFTPSHHQWAMTDLSEDLEETLTQPQSFMELNGLILRVVYSPPLSD